MKIPEIFCGDNFRSWDGNFYLHDGSQEGKCTALIDDGFGKQIEIEGSSFFEFLADFMSRVYRPLKFHVLRESDRLLNVAVDIEGETITDYVCEGEPDHFSVLDLSNNRLHLFSRNLSDTEAQRFAEAQAEDGGAEIGPIRRLPR